MNRAPSGSFVRVIGTLTVLGVWMAMALPTVASAADQASPASRSAVPGPGISRKTSMKIRFHFNEDVFTFVLEDTPPARELADMLPLKLKVSDFASAEKIAYLPGKLTVKGMPDGTDARAGDLAYYAPWGNLALFYKDAPYARGLVRLGHVEGDLC